MSKAKINYLNAKSAEFLAFMIQSGDRGYVEPILRFFDEEGNPPSQENNWLVSSDGNRISGSFEGINGRVFDFTMRKSSSGDWSRTYRPSEIFEDSEV